MMDQRNQATFHGAQTRAKKFARGFDLRAIQPLGALTPFTYDQHLTLSTPIGDLELVAALRSSMTRTPACHGLGRPLPTAAARQQWLSALPRCTMDNGPRPRHALTLDERRTHAAV